MSTVFPTAIDVLPDPGAGTGTADPGFYHDVMHANENDAITALQTKVGINNSPVSFTLDYLMRNHQHLGTDGSSKFGQFVAQPVTDGNVLTALTAGGTTFFQAQSASGSPTVQITATGAGVTGLSVKALSVSQTADLIQALSSTNQALAGIQGNGTIYGSNGLQLTKGYAGAQFLTSQPTNGELDLINGGLIRGYSGSYTGAGGTGEQFHLDGASGFLKLGGVSGQQQIMLNAWNVLRASSIQSSGKDNADSGLTVFTTWTDADGQVLTPRSHFIQGNLGKTATGTLIGNDTFSAYSFPTYDGNITYTKAIGLSVLPGVTPTLTAGTVTINGAASITGALTVSGALGVNALNVSTATTATAGTAGAVPAQVAGYIVLTIGGSTRKIAFYNN